MRLREVLRPVRLAELQQTLDPNREVFVRRDQEKAPSEPSSDESKILEPDKPVSISEPTE